MFDAEGIAVVVRQVREPVHVVYDPRLATAALGLCVGGEVQPQRELGPTDYALLATLPATYPEWLGDRSFTRRTACVFPTWPVKWPTVSPPLTW